VIKVRILHELKAGGPDAGVGTTFGVNELALLFSVSIERTVLVHLRVVTLEGVNVWHKRVLHVGVVSATGAVLVVEIVA